MSYYGKAGYGAAGEIGTKKRRGVIDSLIQFDDGVRGVAALVGDRVLRVRDARTILDLAHAALAAGETLATYVAGRLGDPVDLDAVRMLAPIDHPDAAHLTVSGTGLTHLGSAEGRDKMHRTATDAATQTDSMRMFLMGVDGGKPVGDEPGVQPEWFYKGDGSVLVGPGDPLPMPDFALDGGEEPEVAGIYLIDPDGAPVRIGFALGNEFSDHITERGNYLWLAHSKLRAAALGPELRLGDLPAEVIGTSRIIRDNLTIWEKPFLSGEANMSHSIANLEHHHFKYVNFRRPGDVHVHFFGTATLSFADGIVALPGDVFEIAAAPFTLPVRNPLMRAPANPVRMRQL